MCVFNELGKVLKVESRRLDYMPVVVWVQDEACEGTFQEIHEPRRPLNIRERRRVGRLQEIEHLSADYPAVKIPKQLLIMLAADTEEVHDLPVQVIQHFDLGGFLMEEHLRTSGERFDIRRVLGKERNHPRGQRPFPANVREWSNHVPWGLMSGPSLFAHFDQGPDRSVRSSYRSRRKYIDGRCCRRRQALFL